ncbi:hypothetical protein MVLG_05409 [Microbotryum lychnidis-dioicae p1A1 Lamole]|uniref:Arf-GAP domain-containing protein n=1 Tax=Microbotryum lychnidis-dioicae (strain p1A1 Lamole / MvSl-1064) TaxID=683840 RepID=U5HE61_USTV1|nr:hypothetical protein MVLG_05409 [Microbotryum lychnidis-dioicae p1A1 Lamole]|eukprot:KDE04116.1 hypothetical protein MVLG_05409 [Microbotryum lychnidis-dioicae p1A1 Lamole]
MSARYTQSKAEAARHQEILRAMLKQPENKLCADCKRNDPRWASTNLGCFMCIRCSGIHRGMGVHITRIKSVDLDTWTPEQVAHVQRWGNRRANIYWEAHLKSGHLPPEHKMESFIRSKYELKRWAMEGPIPDPETLDNETPTATAPAPVSSTRPAAIRTAAAPTATRKAAPTTSIDLLAGPGDSFASAPSRSSSKPVAAPIPAATSGGSLFDLDMRPTSTTSAPAAAPAPKRDAKADILSLFASAPPPRPAQTQAQPPNSGSADAFGDVSSSFSSLSFGATPAAAPNAGSMTDLWGSTTAATQSTTPVSHGGFGGGNDDGFGAFGGAISNASSQPAKFSNDFFGGASSSVWGSNAPTHAPAPAASNGNDGFGDWATTTTSTSTKGSSADAFSDIWK